MTNAPPRDSSESPEAAEAFWRGLLSTVASATPLLDDASPGRTLQHPTPRARVESPLSPEQAAAVDVAAAGAGVSPATVLEVAWALVVSTHAREPFVLFGEALTLSGTRCVLPVPLVVPAEQEVRAFLESAEAARAERIRHASPSLGELHALARLPREASLFDSVITLDREPGEVPPHPVPLSIALASDCLVGDYATARLGPEPVRRALRHLATALTELAAHLGDPVSSLSLLGPEDALKLERFNDTAAPYRTGVCLHRLFEEQVARSPTARAVSSEHGSLSYAELNRRSNQLAHRLRSLGVGPGSLVGVFAERSLEMVVGLLAILKAGGAYVPLDPSYPDERIRSMLEDAEPPVILVQGHTERALPRTPARALSLDDPETFAGMPEENPEGSAGEESLAYVIFTSGSTGRPKGAMNDHRGIVNRLLWMQERYGLGPDDRVLQKTPFSFDVSVWELFWPLLAGAELVMARPGGHKDTAYLVSTIVERRITTLHFVPSMLEAFLDDEGAGRCTGVRRVICSGEALTPLLVARFFGTLAAELHNLYGPTEAAVDVTHFQCEKGAGRTTVPIGKPVANTQIYVLDAALRPLPVGVPGELHIGGVQVGRGYLKQPELTREKFVPDPFSAAPGARLYKTGDLARITEDLVVEYGGRLDFQVKLRGFRIELGEIEAALAAHPAVAQAAVLLRKDREADPRLVAYLVPRTKSHPTATVKAEVSRGLPEFMVPSAFVWLDALPRTPSGKLDRKALPPPSRERPDLGRGPVPPHGEQEKILCTAFASFLEIEPVGAEDGFFELGGSSLLALKLLSHLKDSHALTIPVARFFQHPTPRALSAYLAVGKSEGTSARMPRARVSAGNEGVAIIGMAGRFPGAMSVAELWKNVCAGVDSITTFSDQDLDPSLPADLVSLPDYVKARGIVRDYDLFDAGFFGIGKREAELLDPQQRLLLETAWEALENAGYVPETAPGIVGVFAGQYGNTYLTKNVLSHVELEDQLGPFALLVQNEKDYAATRIAHRLDLTGPAVSLNTACSTSLVAVVEAFHSLRTGQCDLALAGAASVTCPPRSGYVYVDGGMLSADGHTRTFDADATGTTFNDGVAMVVLKRLSQAVLDGDTVYGVILGGAINNDGGRKASFTAPSVEGQAAVIRMAQNVAGIDPRSIGYVEAHGTATPLGDPIEIEALTEAFREKTDDVQFCAVSSVKSNIGHLVAAAGATGLIKTALSLAYEKIPPTAHYQRQNPKIDFAQTPFYVARELLEWKRGPAPRRAGVSSFGVGGTNAHVVVEEAPLRLPREPRARPELLLLSARSRSAVDLATKNLGAHLEDHPDQDLRDVAATLALGRRAFPVRRAVVARSIEDAAKALADPAALSARTWDGRTPEPVFLFPGQGAQYPNMGRALYRDDPVFRAVVDDCAGRLLPELGVDLRTLLYADSKRLPEATETLRNTAFTQPALFTIEYAMAEVLIGWGVKPRAMVGHSVGEFVCAALSGVMSYEDALRLVATRGRLMQSLPPGSMLSVRLPAAELAKRLPPELGIASDNGPSLSVVSGPSESVARLERELTGEGVFCRNLLTSHAFHSAMMDPVVEPFSRVVESVRLSPPKIPFVSTLTGTWIRPEEATDPAYWGKHLRATVRYREAARELLREPGRVLVESGPRATLATLAKQQAERPGELVAAATLGDSSDGDLEWTSVLTGLGQLWTAGVPVDFESVHAGSQAWRIPLPTYPFERKRYWLPPIALTRAASEEVDVAAVPDADSAEPSGGIAARPSGDGETASKLRRILEIVSGTSLADADPNATFMELGLDSLALTQVAQQIQKAFSVRITLRDIVERHSSLRALGAHLGTRAEPESRGAAGPPPGTAVAPDPSLPPVPGARLGRDRDGNPAWYVPNPSEPGKFIKLESG